MRSALYAASVLALVATSACADQTPRALPAPVVDEHSTAATETAVLAGGCFWGVQGVFEHVKGVTQVVSGYAGGNVKDPDYETVSAGGTGNAESVRVTFDPRQVSYGRVLQIFFSVAHDPTELNRQGPDEGPNYRSDVFAQNAEQLKIARAYVDQLTKAHAFAEPIVTRLDTYTNFYPAEAYHQDYLIHNPDSMYIQMNDLPKIANLKRIYPGFYSDKPVMVAAR
ncbi:MAG TPA: peptide-methionine (S)-S-oxide reductase MsrA [Rhizomicrobium sp.]|jgi:peptide-methionine (S)-S-oxide reductase